MKRIVIVLLLMFSISVIFAQSNQTETVIGSVYLRVDAGEWYDLYELSTDSFFGYLAGWKLVGERDKRVWYTDDELYDKLMKKALRDYGSSYPDLYLISQRCHADEEDLPDEEYNTQVMGSSTQYKKKERTLRFYDCSATVVVKK